MTEITRHRLLEAEAIVRRLPEVLQRRGLPPHFTEWIVTQDQDLTWLFGVLDLNRLERLEAYTGPDLLHHLSTALGGRPVYLSNHSGLRYAVLLSPPPRLPRSVAFPGFQRGQVLLGVRATGTPVALPWARLGHLLVAGQTGSGKSTFLRLLVYQALTDGLRLLLADLDGATFPMLAQHPALLHPIAATPPDVLALLERALGECEARAAAYAALPGFAESLDEYNALAVAAGITPLPRGLVVLDEFNATVMAAGGPQGPLARAAAEVSWRGRKFGLHLVFAAQDMSKAVVGRVRDQVQAAFCFRVRGAETARALGCAEAVRIPATRPGLALTDRWGPVQTFQIDKARLVAAGQAQGPAPLTEEEAALVQRALAETGGRLSIPVLKAWGWAERAARKRLEEWALRGWVKQDPARDNAHYITPVLAALVSNRPTGPTASSPVKPAGQLSNPQPGPSNPT